MTFLKILLIDDDQINNYLNKRLLQKSNFAGDIVIKMNGREGIDYLRNLHPEEYPDLILLDINMPVMDGYDFISLFNFLPEKEKMLLIILSSTENHNDLDLIQSLGLKIITKPLTPKKLEFLVSSKEKREI